MEEKKVYTLDEIADILKTTKRTLYTYIKDGKLRSMGFLYMTLIMWKKKAAKTSLEYTRTEVI